MFAGTAVVVSMKRGVKEILSHPLDAEVKTLYSPPPRCRQRHRDPINRKPDTEESIVQRPGHTANRSLPLKGRCALVRAAFGKSAVVTMNERHLVKSQRPAGSLGHEGRMHPGKGGA